MQKSLDFGTESKPIMILFVQSCIRLHTLLIGFMHLKSKIKHTLMLLFSQFKCIGP